MTPDVLFTGCNHDRLDEESLIQPVVIYGDANGDFPHGERRRLTFASNDRETAMLYTLKTDHMVSVEHGNPNIAICIDYEGWKEALKGLDPTLYHLPGDTFTQTIKPNGSPTNEWTTTEAVRPTEVEKVTPEAVMKTGGN